MFWKRALNKGMGLMIILQVTRQMMDNIITETSNLFNLMLTRQASRMEDWDSDSNIVAEQLFHLQVSFSESDMKFFFPLLLCKIVDLVSVLTTMWKFSTLLFDLVDICVDFFSV